MTTKFSSRSLSGLLVAGLAMACSFGTEVRILDSNDLVVTLGHAVTTDRSALFTIEESGLISAFELDGDTIDWQYLADDPRAITNDPSERGAARYLSDSGVTKVTLVAQDILFSDTVALPSRPGVLCDLSVDSDGDLYVTQVHTLGAYVWSQLDHYDAQTAAWTSVFLDFDDQCARVSADPASSQVAVLMPGAIGDNVQVLDSSLRATGGFVDDSAKDLDFLGGHLLLGRIGTGQVTTSWHNHLQIVDSDGNHLTESPVEPYPFFVQFDIDDDLFAWVGGEDIVSTLPIY